MTSRTSLLHGQKRKRHSCQDYTIGCVCPMGVELAPLRAMLDAEHDDLPIARDRNAYILGEMGKHNIAICVLSSIGTNGCAVAATRFRDDFPAIQFFLLVGIAGGVPGPSSAGDIRLGDVVVSTPSGTTGGVVQFDYCKALSGNELKVNNHLNKPPHALTAYVKMLEARYQQQQSNGLGDIIGHTFHRNPRMQEKFRRPEDSTDQLFSTHYRHEDPEASDCLTCDPSYIVPRPVRKDMQSVVHYGTIGSSNLLLRDAEKREQLRKDFGVLAVEMEAAGLIDHLPCLVIRGICDYADSHKNKRWQPYAALAAAAYANELLQVIPTTVRRMSMAPSEASGVQTGSSYLPSASDSSSFHREPRSTRLFETHEITDKALYKKLLKSLTFNRMDARMHNIPDAMLKTCSWLFDHPTFHTWLDGCKTQDHHGFLWIRGKPGSGKSTIMKAILDHMKTSKTSENFVSYFFNARASGTLEKSSLGMYRSLVHQFLSLEPSLETCFLEQFRSKFEGEQVDDWTIIELQNFLLAIVKQGKIQHLNVLIDALDEGENDHDIRRMVSFLEDLTQHASSHGSLLRICLSTRHYPWFRTHKSVSLVMEDQPGHDDDIKLYIRNRLACDLTSDLEELQNRVHKKAAGVFLWVVLVIPLLNEAYDEGQMDAMTSLLDTVPDELDDVFNRILARSRQLVPECVALLQWTMFSKQALSPSDTLTAIRCSVGTTNCKQQPQLSHDDLRRYLLHCSRGLTEISASQPPVVQFIHETVRDYIGKRGGIAMLSQDLAHNFKGLSHDRLRETCYRYLQDHSITKGWAVTEERGRRAILKARISGKDSFLRYAVKNVFWHAEMAQIHSVSQREFLSQHVYDTHLGIRAWILLHNAYEAVRANKYTLTVPPLYIFAEHGLVALVRLLLEMSKFDFMTQQRFGSALQAACHLENEEMVRILLKAGADVNDNGGEHKFAFFAAVKKKSLAIMKLLAEYGAKAQDMGFCGYLSRLNTPLFERLCAPDDPTVVDILLKIDADINAQLDSRGRTALMVASENGHKEIVRQLLAIGADVNVQKEVKLGDQSGMFGMSCGALLLALREGHVDIAQMLLENGADEHVTSYASIEAAYIRGDHKTVETLLAFGANIDTPEPGLSPLLRRASTQGHPQIVRLLLEHGIDVNAHRPTECPILWQVIEEGLGSRIEVIRELIAHGADVNKRMDLPWPCFHPQMEDGFSQGPSLLEAAILYEARDCEVIVELLQQGGARGPLPDQYKFYRWNLLEGWTGVGLADD